MVETAREEKFKRKLYEGKLSRTVREGGWRNTPVAKQGGALCSYRQVGGALVDDGDDGDLLNDIVRRALGQIDVGRAEGMFGLGNTHLETASPLGSPTAISPRLVITLADLARQRRDLVAARRGRKATSVVENQMTLF